MVSDAPGEKLPFRRARSEDEERLRDLLSEAARYQATWEGEDSWPSPFPLETLRKSIDRGETYLLEREGTPIVTLALSWEDSLFWGERPPDAGYVHKLAVSRAFAHQGLGVRALEWAAAQIRDRGRPWVRLDCLATNPGLVHYYRDLGFREVGRRTLRASAQWGGRELTFVLYECPADPGPRRSPHPPGTPPDRRHGGEQLPQAQPRGGPGHPA